MKIHKILATTITLSGIANANAANKIKTDKNILLIIVDDLNNTLACYGNEVVKTPNINQLSQMGVQFNNAYCNYPVSNPSRSSFLTGLYPESAKVLNNTTHLKDVLGDKITLPYLFKENGFCTMSIGKVFHGSNEQNDPKAWDEFHMYEPTAIGKTGESRNITNGVLKWCTWMAANGTDEDLQDGQNAKKAIEFIESKKTKPFFLALGFQKPHDPFIAPKKYFDMYPLNICNPPIIPDGWKPPYPFTLPAETTIFNKFSDQDKREFLRSYYACTTYMDAQLGKVLKALKETKQLDNTLIIFMGDNGYHLGEQNWWNKVTLFEKGTNPPFIVVGNSVGKKNIRTNTLIEFVDLYPTLADIFKLKNTPDYLEGKSFKEILKNPELPFRDVVYAVVSRGEFLGKMVKSQKWRYEEWDDAKKGIELYDQINDKFEYNNLAQKPEYAEIINQMKALMHKPR